MNQLSLIQKRAALSLLVALAVHGLILASWVSVIILEVAVFKPIVPEKKLPPEQAVTVILRAIEKVPQDTLTPLAKLKPKPTPVPPTRPKDTPPLPAELKPPATPRAIAKPEQTKPTERKTLAEQKQRFARTSTDQEGTPDAHTDILGERDTRAASELPPSAVNKPNTPSQNGAAPLHPGHVETVERRHVDGSVGMDKIGDETERPQEATARKDSETIDQKPALIQPEPGGGSAAKIKNKHLAEGELRPTADNGVGKSTIQDKTKRDEAPKEKPNLGSKNDGQGDATEQTPKKDGFRGLSRKTRVTGSISRSGKSALNVKNSALGRYQAQVSKAVELQWRRKCDEHRDHIVPGVVSVRFYVDSKGLISGVKFQEVIGASYIMTGFTQRAIRQTKLPKMSSSVKKELQDESLELIYNFYF